MQEFSCYLKEIFRKDKLPPKDKQNLLGVLLNAY